MDESSKEMLKRDLFCARFVVEVAGEGATISQDLP